MDIDPCSRLFDRFKMIFHSPSREKLFELDNANVNVVPFANNQVYALTETSMLVKVNPKNLSVIKTENVYKKMYPTLTSIAHPHVEHDGSWISIGINVHLKCIMDKKIILIRNEANEFKYNL